MSQNLWRSEDVRYTLGFRVGPRPADEPVAAPEPAERKLIDAAELDRINILMELAAEKLQRQAAA